MNQLHASRFQQSQRKRPGFITRNFPYGSLKRKIGLYAAVPLAIIIILVLIVDQIIMPTVTRHHSEFPLPDFIGQRLIETQVSLKDLGLNYEISSEEYSPGKEQGIILNQFPVATTKVKSGRVIKLVVSLGKKMIPIPDVAGKSVRQAMLDLETSGLNLGEIAYAYSDTIPEKIVVFSYPEAGAEIPLGSPVNLMVNKGRASTFTYMPKIIGLSLSEASKWLEDKYLKVGIVTYRTDENYLPETVLEQSEPVGTELDNGTEIDLVISTT